MGLHVFVAMPYGVKQNIDFNHIYAELIRPALESAGFTVFRADEEMRAGDIRSDMFQELLLADLVVADLSIDNPNVWYELGVRHALRPKGVIQIQSQRDYMPFDVYVDRSVRYHLKDGRLDPDKLEDDRKSLAAFARETMNAWHERRVSPVYNLLPFLKPPDWKTLRLGGINELWEELERWQSRVRTAQKAQRAGDVLVFAGEAPTRALEMEARLAAANALLKLEHFAFALEQCDCALAIEPQNVEARRVKGIVLGRLERYPEADVWLRELVEDDREDGENWGLLGRVAKDAWLARWRRPGFTDEQKRKAAASEAALLREAVKAYETGFRKDARNYYPGVNALSLVCLCEHLTGKKDRRRRNALDGGIRWSLECALAKDQDDYWARASVADLELLNGDPESVTAAYKEAVAVAQNNRFALNSSRQQLEIFRELAFRPPQVQAAIEVVESELAALPAAQDPIPGKVFLFSGHMIDKPDRHSPRFPPDKEPIAAKAIADQLDELGAGPGDLAFSSGACGGDLLFAEAVLKRGLGLRVRIPFDEPTFIQRSVAFAGDQWVDRFYAVKSNPNAAVLVMPDILGPPPKSVDPFSRNNLWTLYSALSWGPQKVRFLCLWDRGVGDGPGGTAHMHQAVSRRSGFVRVLDTKALW
jgi:tetratricopeptide (TPR) repeat protein